MTFPRLLGTTLILTMFHAGTAWAGWYGGPKIGSVQFDVDTGSIDRQPVNAGGTAGYRWPLGLGLEGEITYTASKGTYSVDLSEFGAGVLEQDLTIGTAAAYGTYRSGESAVYFKGKAGYAYETIEVGPDSDDDGNASYGIGLGWNLAGGRQLEIEYTVIEDDVDFLSIGFNF